MMEAIELKLNIGKYANQDLAEVVRDDKYHWVKFSSTKYEIIYDRKNPCMINTIKNVKIVYGTAEGTLVLMGNLQLDFHQPIGGSFYVHKVVTDVKEYADVEGVSARVKFITIGYPSNIDFTADFMSELIANDDFEFDIDQFDEFMEIFQFYRELSDELNNNYTFATQYQSEPYYFIPADVKEYDSEFKKPVKDMNHILKGYRVSASEYGGLKASVQDRVMELIDIRIAGGAEEIKKIRRAGDGNVYLSNLPRVSDKDVRKIKQFQVINYYIDKDEIVISGELKSSEDYENTYAFLNLYDMGQKIKIDSIDNSLRLINQGATGAASELLEYLIGDEKMPNKRELAMTPDRLKYAEELNESQRKAFLKAIDGSPVTLIKGPPGTGKTHVINAITQYITKELGEKVIVSSQTHIAIDNVLDKLVENYDLVVPKRITNRRNKYSVEAIDDTLYRTWGRKFESHNKKATNKALAEKILADVKSFIGEPRFEFAENADMGNYSVIGATTTTSAIAGKKGLEVFKGFDWLIIDEVSKCPITEVLRYLPYVERIIMVGDDFQLAPLLEFSKEDVKDLESYDEEMFEKMQLMYEQSVFAKVLKKAEASKRLILLDENYRSVNDILSTYNVFYDGKLKGRRELTRPEKVHFENKDMGEIFEKNDVFFVEVLNGQEAKDGTSRFNVEEIRATEMILRDLMKTVKNPSSISVSIIFPYAAQISHFQRNNISLINEAKSFFKSFEIDTVDAFQGKETDIVLVNTVVADATQRNFLNDFRRINVSMSRARDKLIVFGNSRVLKTIPMKITGGAERKFFGEIINFISKHGGMIEYNGGKVEYGNSRKNGIKLA